MLKSGSEHLEGLRDGRVVYIGGERVLDVTRHPAFAEAAKVVAAMYEAKRRGRDRVVVASDQIRP